MAALQPLKVLTVPPVAKHTATVIFVHGLGDSGHGWQPVADMFRTDPAMQHVKWVLPHAPEAPVTANMGMTMPSWFDILEFGFKAAEDEKGMLATSHSLNQLITAEVDAGIEPSRIVLGGFSQGGAMTVLTGLSNERKLGGLVVLSGWVPIRSKLKAMVSAHIKELPIFWGHGKEDPLVRYELATASRDFMKSELGIREASSGNGLAGLSFNSYDGVAHSTNNKELSDLHSWLKKVLSA